tara:strand:- start:5079 stop:5462 length:384 start_codon:yes stop_codon:yes gene_type:complete
MTAFAKKQIFICIRDLILISLFIYAINFFTAQLDIQIIQYASIVLIFLIFGYCLLKCLWALMASLLILISINYYFQKHSTKKKNLLLDLSALFNFFTYLYLISISINTFEKINKIDLILLILKIIGF